MNSSDAEVLTPEALASLYPLLYHMAGAGRWESIRRIGLLSTTALLDLFEVTGEERERIESQRRATSIEIRHPEHGLAVIRDNLPMTDRALEKCLRGLSPREWYETLNRRVFFWLSRERLFGLLEARAYRGKHQTVLTIDTSALLARHADRVTLSPINSGSTIMNPAPRGADTFARISEYPYGLWRKKRGRKNAVVELAVDYSVPDVRDFVVRVEHVDGGSLSEVLWER
ncbi:MAG TPA: hypothetical protein VF705_09150 [Longimicrobium sp.]